MELSPGSTLLHYRLVEQIGEGGMGAVWRSVDTTLDREVALKVLPPAFAGDAERHARFEREAKVLASLNHPNVATLYGLEHVDGQHVLVMELVEGEGLDQRVARGPVAVSEAVPIAIQIALGLEAAHDRGIVHRDLKPANVMINCDGAIKVLDFGLATVWESAPADTEVSKSPTLTAMTGGGVLSGTAPYMSPEQARAQTTDKRTDIWAFGAVLYEMLTGKRCFTGDTVTDVLASVVKDEPDWRELPDDLPWRLRELLGRLLEKDFRKRLRDLGDARWILERVLADPEEESRVVAATRMPRIDTPAKGWLWLAAGLVAGGFVGALLIGGLRGDRQGATAPVSHFQVALPEGQMLAFGRRVPNTIGVAPDGRTIAAAVADRGSLVDYYTESAIDTRLWLRSLDSRDGFLVPGTEGAMQPFFSPDGRSVAFFARGKLRRTLVAGGGVVETVCDVNDPWGGSWTEDDVIIFSSSRAEGLVTQLVPAAGGTPEMMAELETSTGEQEHNFPSLLPGDRWLLYMAWRAGETSFARTLVYDLESGLRTTLVEGGLRPEYHPPYLLYNVGPNLFGARMTVDPPALTGPSVELADDLLVDPDYDAGQWSASGAGTLVYATGGRPQTDQQLVWVELDGSTETILKSEKTIRAARLQDERVLFANIDINADIYAHDLRRGTTTRLTVDPAWDGTPVPSRLGNRVAFGSYRAGVEKLFIIEPDGSILKPLEAGGAQYPTSWSRDDRWLAYTERNPSTVTDIWLLPMNDEGGDPVPFAATEATEGDAAFSPTSDLIAYVSDQSGSPEVWVRTYPPNPGKGPQLVASGGGTGPLWSRDGRRLYFHTSRGLVSVDVAYEPTLRLGQPILVLADPTLRVMDIAADGRLLAIKSKAMPEVTTLNVILGFDRLLEDQKQ